MSMRKSCILLIYTTEPLLEWLKRELWLLAEPAIRRLSIALRSQRLFRDHIECFSNRRLSMVDCTENPLGYIICVNMVNHLQTEVGQYQFIPTSNL